MTEVYALIPAAGRGARFNKGSAGTNKVFASAAGKSILRHTVERFAGHALITNIVVVSASDEIEHVRRELTDVGHQVTVVVGGQTRQQSVLNGLRSIPFDSSTIVVVHDAARPNVSEELITKTIASAREFGSGVAAISVTDTLKRADDTLRVTAPIDRTGTWAIQTPQAFPLHQLLRAHVLADENQVTDTDDSGLFASMLGETVKLVPGEVSNVKVTRREDMEYVQFIQSKREPVGWPETRVGFGYDIHSFGPNRRLVLGGMEIPTSDGIGLVGHSDADVLIHAICDALLGAAGLPDIGIFFPNTDNRFKDVDSKKLLSAVRGELSKRHYSISNVDCTLIAERPKISPYVAEMKTILAGVLGINPEQVGVKATTNEGLGSLGDGLGVAAHAVAAVCLRPNME